MLLWKVNKYNNTIKMKPVDVNSITYTDFNKESNKEDPKFEVVDRVRISNTKIFLQKVTLEIVLRKFLWLKTLKIPFHRHMLLVIKKLLKCFTKRITKCKLKKVEEIMKRKSDKVYVKLKDYFNSFNGWIDKMS